eukprot:800903-Rhodomonas_salina.1
MALNCDNLYAITCICKAERGCDLPRVSEYARNLPTSSQQRKTFRIFTKALWGNCQIDRLNREI